MACQLRSQYFGERSAGGVLRRSCGGRLECGEGGIVSFVREGGRGSYPERVSLGSGRDRMVKKRSGYKDLRDVRLEEHFVAFRPSHSRSQVRVRGGKMRISGNSESHRSLKPGDGHCRNGWTE